MSTCVEDVFPGAFQGGEGLAPGGGGGWKKFARFFCTPPPLRGYPSKKKLAPHVGIFFCQEEFSLLCAT